MRAGEEVGGERRRAGDGGLEPRDVGPEVEVGDGVDAPILDGGDVVGARRLLLGAVGAEVEVLVAEHPADPGLPPPVVVVPCHSPVLGNPAGEPIALPAYYVQDPR